MKIPFYTVFGPHMKRHCRFVGSFCDHPFLWTANAYTTMLSVMGAAFSVYDMVMIMKCGPTLPGYMVKGRSNYTKLIGPTMERDFKLIALLLSFEYYTLLLVGVMMKHPIFFLPFLMLYAFIIVMELITFILRMFTESNSTVNKTCVFSSMFVIYNWLCVFCCFWHKMDYYDY